jgi:hypothetical protein
VPPDGPEEMEQLKTPMPGRWAKGVPLARSGLTVRDTTVRLQDVNPDGDLV